MEVFVRNLSDQSTEKQINNFFNGVLEKLDIKTFHLKKLKGKGCAIITIHDSVKAQYFLNLHGQTGPGREEAKSVKQKLYHSGRQVICSRSNKAPDEYLLLHLKKEESDRYIASQKLRPKLVPPRVQEAKSTSSDHRSWSVTDLKCGQWAYEGKTLVFAACLQEAIQGRIIFAQRAIRINLRLRFPDSPKYQLDIPYSTIHSFTLGSRNNPSITLSLNEAPKCYEETPPTDPLLGALQALAIQAPKTLQFKRKRISAINKTHELVAGTCLCYRFLLSNPKDIAGLQALKRFPMIPDSIQWSASTSRNSALSSQFDALNSALSGYHNDDLPYALKFQLQKLAQNGCLNPATVLGLIPVVARHLRNRNPDIVAQSVRNLVSQVPYAGPETDSSDLSIEALNEFLLRSQDAIAQEEAYSTKLANQYDHIADIHKATVTPSGVYLFGPEPEMKNRVLRKYTAFPDYFLSVSFLDEDGEQLRLDRWTSGEAIYHNRFTGILDKGINIAGRQYQHVIKDLGDFSEIRSPAKCAARIGQTFSQTLSSVTIPPEAFNRMPDVERNGRTFSDGVGTCSSQVLQQIWTKYAQARTLKPTVLQIRFQGAKGVISLDTRLDGAALRLRPSMIKFGGTNVADIEICGAANKPLSMYLNRQLIKIFEDLGVPPEPFLKLQSIAVEKLRMTTLSAINASSFFQRNFIGKEARLPWLIRKLWAIGFSFTDDDFLRNTLELAVLIELREIKHRSRILVDNGVTLYGIMDETGFLNEGEIYCTVHGDGPGHIVTGNVVITRCPALHPGDVQCVTAIDVPEDSPLRALHNVVVFSSHGERDLPSQLSGGDLDGDLYNVIYDIDLYPKQIAHPADYLAPKPIDIGRPVERSDMTDFFVKFMENDNLGLIATLHQIVADQSPIGTFDEKCIELASMHSTAVDFSKTGIPVEFTALPKFPKFRPDFQAPGPRVLIEKEINFEDDPDASPDEEGGELADVASYQPPKLRYYESPKILGMLYREIDEQSFFEEISAQAKKSEPNAAQNLLNDVLWNSVREKTALIQWQHYIEFAKNLKENYEDNLVDTMTQNSNNPRQPISEIEVFAGNILGKNGAQSKRQRETSKTMKEKHERDVEYTVSAITRGDDGQTKEEALERSIACVYVACHTIRDRRTVGKLVSFGWIAAAVCLKEMEKLPGAEVL
ncbi:hypothetical protein ACLMJK_000773 [Lecanora helva]